MPGFTASFTYTKSNELSISFLKTSSFAVEAGVLIKLSKSTLSLYSSLTLGCNSRYVLKGI